jgi:hypothetical protein
VAPTPTATPRPTATAKGPPKGTPTAGPTKGATPNPTATPGPTPTPDFTAPTLSSLGANPTAIFYSSSCLPKTTTISVTASDVSGVNPPTLWYDPPGATYSWLSKQMTLFSGTIFNGVWRTTVTGGTGWTSGNMPFYATDYDTNGNLRIYPTTNYPSVTVNFCVT